MLFLELYYFQNYEEIPVVWLFSDIVPGSKHKFLYNNIIVFMSTSTTIK